MLEFPTFSCTLSLMLAKPPPEEMRYRLVHNLFASVDIASTAVFRVAFGVIAVWEVYRYFDNGWIENHFITPRFHFHYYGFGWVSPLPGDGMYYVWGAMGVAGVFIALGFLYRVAAWTFFALFAYMFFIEQTRYLNHFYLFSLMAFLMAIVPAHRAYSIDAWLFPKRRSETIPAWCLWLLRFQIGAVYFFGGVHKTNPDWLHGEPMRTWLPLHTDDFPIIGPYLDEPWMLAFFVYGGLLLDFLAVPMLLWRWTRIPMFVVLVGFHLFNAKFFSIGIFPWFMICATALFFAPNWPRRIVRQGRAPTPDAATEVRETPEGTMPPWRRKMILGGIAVYAAIQLLLPWRPYLYPGHILWTEQGLWFSWNMMLSIKRAYVVYEVHDPDSGGRWTVRSEDYLTPFQQAVSVRKPDMILQFAHHLAEQARKEGLPRVEVYAKSLATLNGRTPQVYIDPTVNLAAVKRDLLPERWVVPLKEPLPPREPWQGREITEDDLHH